MSESLSKEQIEKIGNSVIYFSTRVGELAKTKLLKLLFLLEEDSIKKFGKPFFGLSYKVWQFGPVAEPIYQELTGEEIHIFKDYFKKNQFDEFEAVKEFNDDEFSDNDISLLDERVSFARNKIAKDFVNITHAQDSLWTRTAKKHGVYEDLESKRIPKTDYSIDFSMLFEGDTENDILEKYQSYIENLTFSENFKVLRSV
jgi:uncharacterized phage-associated protein